MTPKYIRDLHSYIEAIPYGDVTVSIRRVNRKSVEIVTAGVETLRYESNDEAIADVVAILKSLMDSNYSGKAHVECEYRDGNIKIVAIHDQKITKY